MDKESLLRLVDSLHRDKEIAKDVVFQGIEAALTTAARKHFKSQNTISIQIDRDTGEIMRTLSAGRVLLSVAQCKDSKVLRWL